jgi:cation diffusion facilitator CzcD-associated flavoprotein CzcO
MSSPLVDIAIIGAGPYGLSIAAHLRKTPLSYRIFGTPMESWSEKMPKGMMLKSDGFASSLYDPDSEFTLRHYCEQHGLPYSDVGLPVPGDTFVAYGRAFQQRFVPNLEHTNITSVRKFSDRFELQTAEGDIFQARNVIVAAGITHFRHLPPFLADLPEDYVTHSLHHYDLDRYAGKEVAVIGAGASAVDLAALLNEAGAKVVLVARREQIAFHSPSKEPRPLLQRMLNPRSGLGLGWKSRLCTDAPLLFHALPLKLRIRAVQRHLGPAPGWFVRDKVIDRFPLHLGVKIKGASIQSGKVHLNIVEKDGTDKEMVLDNIIGATGFHVDIERLWFLDESIRKQIETADDSPVLSRRFESSVRGLYMVGLASANSFGPLCRFAYGAKYTAKHLSDHLTATVPVRA